MVNNVQNKHTLWRFFLTGHVPRGLRVHPDRDHLIYPLGCTVILKSLTDGKQEFLHGHTNNVSCVAVSKTGCYVGSGQVTFMGFKVTLLCCDTLDPYQRVVVIGPDLH